METDPFALIRQSISEKLFIKCRGDRELRGTLHAFDEHLNMVLSDAEESLISYKINPSTGKTETLLKKRTLPLIFVRGDGIVLISPPPVRKSALA